MFSEGGTFSMTTAYIYRFLLLLFLLTFTVGTFLNQKTTILQRILKIGLLFGIFASSFLLDFQILKETSLYARRLFLFQSLYLVFFFLFLIKNLNIQYVRLLGILPLAVLAVYSSILTGNTYAYERSLNATHLLNTINRTTYNLEQKITSEEFDQSKTYEIHFADGEYRLKYPSFKTLPLHFDSEMTLSSNQIYTIKTIKILMADHLDINIDGKKAWEANKENPNCICKKNAVTIDNENDIIWINCDGYKANPSNN